MNVVFPTGDERRLDLSETAMLKAFLNKAMSMQGNETVIGAQVDIHRQPDGMFVVMVFGRVSQVPPWEQPS